VVLIEAIDFIYDAVRLDEKLLIREFNNLNVNYRLVNAGELTLNLPNGGDGGAAFIRTISQHKSQLVSQLYEALGGISINPAMSILIGNNKAVTLAIFVIYGSPGSPPVTPVLLAAGVIILGGLLTLIGIVVLLVGLTNLAKAPLIKGE